MVRAPIVDKDGVRRGAWSLEEDFKLRAYVEKYGPWKWREVPRLAGLTRCGKSCRLRWLNYLRPGLKRGNYTSEENELICKLHEKHGNRWSTIAAKLPGRTDNEVKNHWNAHLKKQVKPKPESSSITDQPKAKQSGPTDIITSSHVGFEAKTEDFSDYSSTTFGILESSSVSSQQTSSSDNDNYVRTQNWVVDQDYDQTNGYGDFWTEPFVWDINRNNVGHVVDASLQFSAEYGVFSPQHETTYDDDDDYNIDLFSAFYCNFGPLK